MVEFETKMKLFMEIKDKLKELDLSNEFTYGKVTNAIQMLLSETDVFGDKTGNAVLIRDTDAVETVVDKLLSLSKSYNEQKSSVSHLRGQVTQQKWALEDLRECKADKEFKAGESIEF